jgi:transcriptional regulator with XRE-family HTH domain
MSTALAACWESSRAEVAATAPDQDRLPPGWADSFRVLVDRLLPGSGGMVGYRFGYQSSARCVSSSSSLVGMQALAHQGKPVVEVAPAVSLTPAESPIIDQLRELQAALSVNRSQLADVLRVTRPTLYDWLAGKEPNDLNASRIDAVLRILARAGISGTSPLNARFVRRSPEPGSPSLLTLLLDDALDEPRILEAIRRARAGADEASQRQRSREDRLRQLGFEEPDREQRQFNLAASLALRDLPPR